jgi:uncharacterized protein (DUF433 family)
MIAVAICLIIFLWRTLLLTGALPRVPWNRLFALLDSAMVLCHNDGMKKSVIMADREIMGGTPVFRGTRVPVQTLLDCIEAGDSISEFLKGFPTVSRKQVLAVLEEMKEKLLVPAHA